LAGIGTAAAAAAVAVDAAAVVAAAAAAVVVVVVVAVAVPQLRVRSRADGLESCLSVRYADQALVHQRPSQYDDIKVNGKVCGQQSYPFEPARPFDKVVQAAPRLIVHSDGTERGV
jgi:hypothetical protein